MISGQYLTESSIVLTLVRCNTVSLREQRGMEEGFRNTTELWQKNA